MQRGFTLVEIALVLVILGLITGGILGGQALIRSSELKAQLKDFEMISAAHHSFREQYNCIPGDCRDTSRYFPSIGNGDGDGYVEVWPASGSNEGALYFLSLDAAGLLPLQTPEFALAPEYRRSRLFTTRNFAYINFYDRYPGGGYSPTTLLGTGIAWINYSSNVNSPWANAPALRPEDSYNYDVKIDDGKALTGNYLSVAGFTGPSTTLNCIDGSGNYVLTNTDVACRVIVKIE